MAVRTRSSSDIPEAELALDAHLVGGNREYEDGDVDNAALMHVQGVDNLWDSVGEPEYVRVKRLRVSW